MTFAGSTLPSTATRPGWRRDHTKRTPRTTPSSSLTMNLWLEGVLDILLCIRYSCYWCWGACTVVKKTPVTSSASLVSVIPLSFLITLQFSSPFAPPLQSTSVARKVHLCFTSQIHEFTILRSGNTIYVTLLHCALSTCTEIYARNAHTVHLCWRAKAASHRCHKYTGILIIIIAIHT